MTASQTIARFLSDSGVSAAARSHPRSATAAQAAHFAHVPETAFAKAVVLKDDDGFFLAVLPASRSIVLGGLWRETHRPARLAEEAEIAGLFPDCDLGAVPPFGAAYGLDVLVDDSLLREPTVYCEGGDHETLLEVSGADFAKLMASARHGTFAQYRDADSLSAHPS
ncbi:aminoacyl-tRNA deacylase [Ferruginivarius sediminum]|uniref:YbaK/aminoacyl-tRNA synthetase-associated domain-containing protein n=1 Tax=Ferruginivarius sediminum TaxID=2661937 RepID=A0A369TDI5_9PROT|nr:YbaK/EbsC family protein [Ferruginivarius sediminum]RDD63379.1 hypothetical protein DRB17_02740 [Ferruginivarius sediminum]